MHDHHNRGGGFLVIFDQPISGACGLQVEIPSDDGSFLYDTRAAWTVDCNGQQIDPLLGMQ